MDVEERVCVCVATGDTGHVSPTFVLSNYEEQRGAEAFTGGRDLCFNWSVYLK